MQISAEEQKLLMQGEISDGAHAAGVVLNLLVGFGVGQAVQGRWGDTGWIFTLGESASFVALMYGFASVLSFSSSENEQQRGGTALFAGLIGYLVFRTWSVADAAVAPGRHNRKVRELRMRMGMPMPLYGRLAPFVAPTRDSGGGVAGLTLRF
jgi:hypothetical protein